jgi:hypothetical protein
MHRHAEPDVSHPLHHPLLSWLIDRLDVDEHFARGAILRLRIA